MRTVLCSTRAVRPACLLVLAASMVSMVVLPATSADAAAVRKGERVHGHGSRAGVASPVGTGEVRLGPAAAYVRSADGTVRRVR